MTYQSVVAKIYTERTHRIMMGKGKPPVDMEVSIKAYVRSHMYDQ